jgi:hypothetical protein
MARVIIFRGISGWIWDEWGKGQVPKFVGNKNKKR